MSAFVEARIYNNREIPGLAMLVAADAEGRLFRVDRLNEEWIPGPEFELQPEKTMTWQLYVSESRRLNPDMPQEYPMGNDL